MQHFEIPIMLALSVNGKVAKKHNRTHTKFQYG